MHRQGTPPEGLTRLTTAERFEVHAVYVPEMSMEAIDIGKEAARLKAVLAEHSTCLPSPSTLTPHPSPSHLLYPSPLHLTLTLNPHPHRSPLTLNPHPQPSPSALTLSPKPSPSP